MEFKIGSRTIGPTHPPFVIAELSANHGQDLETARRMVRAAAESGADAIKLQTYRPDTLTIDCDNDYFQIQGTAWAGQTLYQLYESAFTPWEWHAELQSLTHSLGLEFFSTPFDETAVDFLETLDVLVYKIASFELVDIGLLKKVASTGKPVIASTGMATKPEIELATKTLKENGCQNIALLKCTSAYPAPAESMGLNLIPRLKSDFECVTGLSDHSLGNEAAIASITLGGSIIEKHFTLSRELGGPDAGFSLEPDEFKQMVDAVHRVKKMLSDYDYGPNQEEKDCRQLRRSIFVVRDINAGQELNSRNLRSIRPGFGLPTEHLESIVGKTASCDIKRGTPLQWKHVA